ncbi:MAG: zinc-domain-containing protein [Nitrososphaerales archaeon]
MEAKCPQCEKRAEVNDEMTKVKCQHCGYEDNFEGYIEKMKDRVGSIVTNYTDSQNSFNE